MGSSDRSPPRAADRLVLYDGQCGFCDASVQWLLDHDPAGALRYAPLDGPTARAIRQRHPRMPPDLDSLVYVETDGRGRERVYWYSRAVLRICANLPLPWRLAAALRVVPFPLTDLLYRAFARMRYLVFGRLDACRIPAPEERARFLP